MVEVSALVGKQVRVQFRRRVPRVLLARHQLQRRTRRSEHARGKRAIAAHACGRLIARLQVDDVYQSRAIQRHAARAAVQQSPAV